jgi:sarcosine oxidase subunit beta
MDSQPRVAVVGGGISGTSIANSLAERGVDDVVLLERDSIASGTTGRSSGVFETQYFDAFDVELRAKANERFAQLETETRARFHRVGYVRLLLDPADREHFERGVRLQHEYGIDDAQFLSPEEVTDLVPDVTVEDVHGAMYGPNDGYADPSTLAQIYAKRAMDRGADVRTGVEVTGIATADERVTGVETSDGHVSCDVVVNAAGAWSPRLAADVGLDIPVAAYRRQVLVAEPPPNLEYTVPMTIESRIENPKPGVYARDETGESLLFGYFTDDEWNDPEETPADPDNHAKGYDIDYATMLLERLEHRFPRFADCEISGGWSGLHITSADGQPILDEHPDLDGYFLATGFSGKGFQISPMTGELITDLIVHGEPRVMDTMEKFRLDRFD